MTFKSKEDIIRKYAQEYNKSKIIEMEGTKLLNKEIVGESENLYFESREKYHYYYQLQTKIDYILDKLDWDTSVFLKKEFFTGSYKPNWWINYYSRSTYYRFKKKSMNEFLELLYA